MRQNNIPQTERIRLARDGPWFLTHSFFRFTKTDPTFRRLRHLCMLGLPLFVERERERVCLFWFVNRLIISPLPSPFLRTFSSSNVGREPSCQKEEEEHAQRSTVTNHNKTTHPILFQINHHHGPDPTWQTVTRSNGLPNYHYDGMHVGRIHVKFVLLVFGWYTHFVDAILQSASTTSIMAERDGRWYVSRDYGLLFVLVLCGHVRQWIWLTPHQNYLPLICCGGSKLCRVHYCRQHSL